MLFSSSIFLFLFLTTLFVVYYAIPFRWRNGVLLVFNLVFYGWGEPVYILIMFLSIAIDYTHGMLVERCKAKGNDKAARWAVFSSVFFNLALLFLFKYWDFVAGTFEALGLSFMPKLGLSLPIGISFYTFQTMSYTIDVYRGDAKAQRNIISFGTYVTLFPQLIAGPIVRYRTVADELEHRKETWDDFASGVQRFLQGLSKKVLLSNQLAMVVDTAFQGGDPSSTAFAWLGALCFILQIYYDFSGYSDMAIGLGRMFGFHFLENFNYPFISTSLTELWRRWHISLSSWFRDYVYFPLGGSRVDKQWKVLRNLFIVWLLTGLWHGANWTFVIWGMFTFSFLMLEKYAGLAKRMPKWFGWFYTNVSFLLSGVFFRADTVGEALSYFRVLLHLGGDIPLVGDEFLLFFREYAVFLLAAVLCAVPSATWIRKKLETVWGGRLLVLWDLLAGLTLMACFLLSICFLIKGTYNPFIYFNF